MDNTITVNVNDLTQEERNQLISLLEKSNERKSKKRWRGKTDESYYCIWCDGQIDSIKEMYHPFDERTYKNGNYFKTEEEAKFELNKRLVYQELKDYALEHNEGEIDWTDDCLKWYISYNGKTGFLEYNYWLNRYDIGQIYFSSKAIARNAVNAIGEQRIKKYLFGIE